MVYAANISLLLDSAAVFFRCDDNINKSMLLMLKENVRKTFDWNFFKRGYSTKG